MLTTIVLPTDGSEVAERAFPYAVRLALAAHVPVVLVMAIGQRPGDPDSNTAFQELRAEAATTLERTAAQLRELNVEVQTTLAEQEPSDAILENADQGSVVVMSTHGRGGLGKLVFGSTTEAVIRHARVPLLIVPAHSAGAWRSDAPLRMLVPLDGSDLAAQVLEAASDTARTLRAGMTLLGVVERSRAALLALSAGLASPGYIPEDLDVTPEADLRAYLEQVAERLRSTGVRVETLTVRGFPADAIASTARADGYDLIAMSTRGRSGLSRALLGSVTAGVLQLATVPVLVRQGHED